MDKRYINKFPELGDLAKDKQAELLEQARVEAFVTMKLSGQSALFLFGSLLVFFIPCVLATWYFGFSFVTVLVLGASISAQIYTNSYLQLTLIRRGLHKVLIRTDVYNQ